MQEIVLNFTFVNVNMNKLVIEKFVNDFNPTFRSSFFHQYFVCHIINLQSI